MCTVTFVPLDGGFVFTSNRDESPLRAATTLPPRKYEVASKKLVFPKDLQGGTWFAADVHGGIRCLLNGAFARHKHQPPYRKSRGIILLDSFGQVPEKFAADYDFSGIEPFTLVMINPAPTHRIYTLRWNGKQPFLEQHAPDEQLIWTSPTLYDQEVHNKKKTLFEQWLQQPENNTASRLMELHQTGSIGDPRNDFCMNRDNVVRTVSISQVSMRNQISAFNYIDLLTGQTVQKSIH